MAISESKKLANQSDTIDSATALEEQWQRVRSRLRASLGEASFMSWFKTLHFDAHRKGKITLCVSGAFMRDWLESHYLSRILDHWKKENPDIKRIEIVLNTDIPKAAKTLDRPGPFGQKAVRSDRKPVIDAPPPAADLARAQYGVKSESQMGAPLDPRYTFSSFVTGTSNQLAYTSARNIADNFKSNNHNPLFIYGGVGLGKTHLMHAMAWEMRRKHPERKTLYLTSEKFMYYFIRALRRKDTITFKQEIRDVDMLMIDDIQFIADKNKNTTQEEFFHTFNELLDNSRRVVITSDRPPSELNLEERLRSRLWGLVVDIHPTDYNLRLGILHAKARHLHETAEGIKVPPEVMELLARRIDTNIRELEGALSRVVAYASIVEKPITEEMALDTLKDLLRSQVKRISIDDIQRQVANYFDVKISEMLSARRARAVARPRQVAMYLAKQLTTRSLPEIGRKFGGRDHTTVIHAVRKIEELCQDDTGFGEDVDMLRHMLEN